MAINKVVLGDETLIDLTSDTVTASSLLEGKTAHDRSGQLITGTMSSGGVTAPTTLQGNFDYFGSPWVFKQNGAEEKTTNARYLLEKWFMQNYKSTVKFIFYSNINYSSPETGSGWEWFYAYSDEDMPIPVIPIEIQVKGSGNIYSTSGITHFFQESKHSTLPQINYTKLDGWFISNYFDMSYFCYNSRVTAIPTDYFNSILKYGTEVEGCQYFLVGCHYLKSIPNTGKLPIQHSQTFYRNWCYGCYILDEAINVPVVSLNSTQPTTSHVLNTSSFLENAYRLKNFSFKAVTKAQWHNTTFDASTWGWSQDSGPQGSLTNFGIPEGKEVTDATTYQALKNDPDWWTMNVAYSRYNHDSAVETINNLPDCSAWIAADTSRKNNTFKFKGAAGSATDGGAINTLTDAEIAVAAAKGWTVTLV